MNKAKVFTNGRSQAIRLPKKFRFTSKEVSITKLGRGVVLQPLVQTWKQLFNELTLIPTNDFLKDREDLPSQERRYFE